MPIRHSMPIRRHGYLLNNIGLMEVIKTYKEFGESNNSVSFRISRMEDIYSERSGKTDDPHRHEYYTVLLIKRASGEHIIDFNRYPLAPNQIYFVNPGQVHQVVEYEQSFGYCIIFSTQFLIMNNISLCFVQDLNLFNDYGHAPPLAINDDEFAKLSNFCEEVITLVHSNSKFKEQAIASFLQLIFIQCNNLCSVQTNDTHDRKAGNEILRNFKELVNQNHTRWHAASEYAGKLNITPDHLNRTVKSLIGKTAKGYIQSRIIIEAKRMLCFSELSLKEIGYRLGFVEPANFSSFFKNCTGRSPSQFRKKQ